MNTEEKLVEGDMGGAVCTADSCIGDFAPEHICSVVTDVTPTRKKVNEFFDALEEQMKNLKEGKEPQRIDYDAEFDDLEWKKDHIRKFEYPGTVRYPGDEEYNKLKADWAEKRKAIHDKKVVEPLNRYPNRTMSIGQDNAYSRFDDSREDDFLAWYEDHKKEVAKPQLKEDKPQKKMKEAFEDYDSDLFIIVVKDINSEAFERISEIYEDLHGYVDEDDAWTIRRDELSDFVDEYGVDAFEIYHITEDVADNEDPVFFTSREVLTDAKEMFVH